MGPHKMVVVGDRRLTLPLTAVGFAPLEAADAKALEAALDKLSVDKDVALVVCGESQAKDCGEALARFRQNGRGAVLVVPDGTEPDHLGREALRLAIEQAAGVDLLGKSMNSPNAG